MIGKLDKQLAITPAIDLTVAEYFAGIGLVRMGLEQQGWRVIFANDSSLKKYEMYSGFFPDAALHYAVDDIFNLDPASVPATLLATCSFPCVDLSLAGNMNGIGGKHSSVFWGFIQILQEQANSAPPLVLVENVHGWLHSNGGKDFRLTVKALNDLGYTCDVIALDSLRFTPQSRPRIFLIGAKFKTDEGNSQILKRPISLLPEQLRRSVEANVDLAWFYQDLPEPPHLRKGDLTEIVEKLSDLDSRWWSPQETQRHLKMMAPQHCERVEGLVSAPNFNYRTFFRRIRNGQQRAEVRPDNVAGCLRTAAGGSGKQFLIRVGRGSVKMRAMTPREYARLQGVPDNYSINADGVQALTGFGDAVSVPVINWIAQHSLTPLVLMNLGSRELQNIAATYTAHPFSNDCVGTFFRVHKDRQASFLERNGHTTANSERQSAITSRMD